MRADTTLAFIPPWASFHHLSKYVKCLSRLLFPNHSNHSFPLFVRSVGQSIHPDSAPLDRTEEGRRQFCRETCSSTSAPCESDDEDVDRPSSVRPFPLSLPYRAGYVLYLESDLFPPKPPPPSLRRRPTSNLSNHRTDRQGRRARATDSLTCFLCRRRLPDSRTDRRTRRLPS